jgi:hypothetical protein
MITGGCLCGAVRYETEEKPITARMCWCRLCQYIGAGNATVNVAFPTEGFTITGAPKDFQSIADSGNKMHRRFCPECGVHVFTVSEARPHLVMVRAGTLDDPEIAKPVATIWVAKAPSYACIAEDLPKFEGPPPPIG